MSDVGVNVVEVDGIAPPTIVPAPTGTAAFLGLAERGVPHRAVEVRDLDAFRARFGANRDDAYLGHALEGFLANGGSEAHIIRVVGAGSTPASARLDNRLAAPTPALRVSAGYRGAPDPGPWGDRIQLDVRDDPRGLTTAATGIPVNGTSATLAAVAGIGVGSVLRFQSGTTTVFRKLTTVDPATRQVGWTTPVTPALPGPADVRTCEFRIIVRFRSQPRAQADIVEEWPNLSMETDSPDYVVSRIGHPFTGSRYIAVTDLSAAAPSGEENPAVASSRSLSPGTETAPAAGDYVGSSAAPGTGLHALDARRVQLVAVPDAHLLGSPALEQVTRATLDYCENRGDCMFVGSAPDRTHTGVTIARALRDYTELESDYAQRIAAHSATFQGTKVFGALYAPWIQVADPLAPGPAPTRFIPADGHVMGIYARVGLTPGVWRAPAGVVADVSGALATSARFTDAEHTALVKQASINGIRPTPSAGIIVAASRTLSTDTRWLFVSTRRLFNLVKSSLRDGLRFVRQEPHTDALRRRVRFTVVEPFLLGLWSAGAFGGGAAAEVFTVKCDAENNPPTEVELGNFWIEVYFYPVRPAETVVIVVGQQPSGATAGEG